MIIKDVISGGEKLIARSDAAELTSGCRVRVTKIAANEGDEVFHVLSACLASRRIQSDKFDR